MSNLRYCPYILEPTSRLLKLPRVQEGTINFANLAAIAGGLSMLSRYIPHLPLRLSTLVLYLAGSLAEIRHDVACTPVARVLSRVPGQRLSAVGDQSNTGSTVSLIFLEVGWTASPLVVISDEIDRE